MYQQHISISALTLLLTSGACTSGGSPPTTTPGPSTPTGITTEPAQATRLRFSPGRYRYQFTQTAEITDSGSADTVPGGIVTRALIYAVVTTQPDSSFAVSVSFDSVAIITRGSIPPQGTSQLVSLGAIVIGVFSQTMTSAEIQLPDSLCSYGQLAGIGRELLLPELAFEAQLPMRRTLTDTTTYRSCRAGIAVDVTTTRELKNAGRSTGEIELEQESRVRGLGVLRRDSIAITGSISARGRVLFATLNRLPTLIRSESQGRITVRLGSTTTDFRQQSSQEIQLVGTEPN